jgi:hypothetical protein
MNPIRSVLYTFLFLVSANISFSQGTIHSQQLSSFNENDIATSNPQKEVTENTPNYNILSVVDSTAAQQISIPYPPTKKDFTRLGYNTAMYFGASIVAFGILYAMPESATNWDKQAMKENGITYKWKQNVKAGPVWDHDSWYLNYITHPYCGGIYYMTARSSGFNIFESFLYSAFMSSCFWEYGIEAFAEIPSKQDLIVTPVLGSVVGEGFFYAKKSIFRHDKKVLNSRFLGYTCLTLIDPFNTLLDGLGYNQKTKTNLSLAPVGFDKGANKAIWGVNFDMQF